MESIGVGKDNDEVFTWTYTFDDEPTKYFAPEIFKPERFGPKPMQKLPGCTCFFCKKKQGEEPEPHPFVKPAPEVLACGGESVFRMGQYVSGVPYLKLMCPGSDDHDSCGWNIDLWGLIEVSLEDLAEYEKEHRTFSEAVARTESMT